MWTNNKAEYQKQTKSNTREKKKSKNQKQDL